MEKVYNSEAFVPEEVAKGLHLDLIGYLLEHNRKSEEYTYDIHVTTDGYCTIVEWFSRSFNDLQGEPRFEFVDYDQEVMKELILPDNSIEYVHPYEADEVMANWLKDNPTWHKNEYGVYVDSRDEVDITGEDNGEE